MVIIIIATIVSTRLIKSSLYELTQKTTPYQIKALNLQRAIQSHSSELVRVSASTTGEEFTKISATIPASLANLKKAQGDLAKLQGSSGKSIAVAFDEITSTILKTTEAKLAATAEMKSAVDSITASMTGASQRLRDLHESIQKLQGSSPATMVSGVNVLMTSNAQLGHLVSVRDGLKDLNLYITNIPTTPIQAKPAIPCSKLEIFIGSFDSLVKTLIINPACLTFSIMIAYANAHRALQYLGTHS